MGLFTKKAPCAICGGKVSGLFPSKVDGQYVCKDCYGMVDLPSELPPLTMEQFKEYRQFRAENQQRKPQFQITERINFGFLNTDFVFDRSNRWFSLDPTLQRTIFDGSAIRSFVIREDSQPLFECSGNGFFRYESDVPERVRNLVPMIDHYRMQMEMQRSFERMADEQRRRDPDAPPPPPPPRPSIDLPEPFDRFYIEITLEHPYWTSIKADKKGPTFNNYDPDANDYMNSYYEAVALMERLAMALKEVAFPDVADRTAELYEAAPVQAASSAPVDTVAEIKKYRELVEQGLLTEEEFSAKKRQLLGI